MDKLRGYKTYITLAIGIVLTWLRYLGMFEDAGAEGAITLAEAIQYTLAQIAGMAMRAGVAKGVKPRQLSGFLLVCMVSLSLAGCVSVEAKAAAHAISRDLPVLADNVVASPLSPEEIEKGVTQANKDESVRLLLITLRENAASLGRELD